MNYVVDLLTKFIIHVGLIDDPTGKPELELASNYRKKAIETENNGYHRFAVTLRKIAESYEEEAKRIIEDHKREIEE